MARFYHKHPYYPAKAVNEWVEGEPEVIHEEDSEEEFEEYQELDYEEENSNEGSDKKEGAREIVNKPYPTRSRHEPLPPPFFHDAPPQWITQLHAGAAEDGR